MKKRNKLTCGFCSVIAALSLATISCTNEQEVISIDEDVLKVDFTQEDHSFMNKHFGKRSLDVSDAMNLAAEYGFDASKASATRSSNQQTRVLTKANVDVIPDSIAESLPDTIAYVLYTDNEKCAVISADNRVSSPLLGYVNVKDLYPYEYDNYDFSVRDIVLKGFVDYTYSEIVKYEQQKDSMEQVINEKLNVGVQTRSPNNYVDVIRYVDETGWDTLQVGPLLEVAWKQGSPYNLTAKEFGTCEDGFYVTTGCGPIAIAMIMSYWKYPSRYLGFGIYWDINWDAITANPTMQMGDAYLTNLTTLIAVIGRDSGTTYNCESHGQAPDYYDWIINHGYTGDGSFDYSFSRVKNSLDDGCPVYISGHSTENGHGWVTDGYRILQRSRRKIIMRINTTDGSITNIDGGVEYQTQKYLNHNWGRGNRESWLVDGCFDESHDYTNQSPEWHAGENYNIGTTVYTGIRPQY